MRSRRIRKPWLRLPPLALAALAIVPAANAAKVRISGVDVGSYPDVRVTVVAPAGSRQPELRENGAPVAGLTGLDLGRAKDVVLAVDDSQSMRGRALADAVAGARAFVSAMGPGDRVEVLAFGHEALALTQFSSSGPEADAALGSVRADQVPGTALWDAVVLAAHRLARDPQPGRVIVVLTDGQDVSSSASFADAVAAAHRAKASVYPIGIDGPDFTPAPLQALAERTGGTYHQARSTAQLAGLYAYIGKVLSHTWELRYPTSARPGDALHLTATVPGLGSATRTTTLAGIAASSQASPGVLPAGVWRSSLMPVIVSLAVGALFLLACGFWFGSRKGSWVKDRLQPHLGATRRAVRTRRKRGRRELLQRLFVATERAFANVKQFRALQRLLERADLPLRAAELFYIAVASGFVLGVVGALAFGSLLMTVAFAALGGWLPVLFVKYKARVRIKAFDNQLPDLLITISASLKAGHSFRHAMQAVVDEGAQPTANEFARVLSEAQLGAPIDQALTDMADRVGSKNLTFVVTAVTIQRQVGGSLAGLFDGVAETVRQRQHFQRKVRGLTAMGRMSAYVLIGLPFFTMFAVTLINPTYMSPLYHSSTGHMLIFVMLTMIAFGSLILKKMVSFKG
ncbi:MAG TPA: type II secretion system F family protein [Gaiellaceae bacterium]|nr:type II secretion system F family protein [Gaiellaceae bacterium]